MLSREVKKNCYVAISQREDVLCYLNNNPEFFKERRNAFFRKSNFSASRQARAVAGKTRAEKAWVALREMCDAE